jgi:hypothetical protein
MNNTKMTPHLATKWTEIKQGLRPVLSDKDLDDLASHFDSPCANATDANLFFKRCGTLPNPKRCGVLDVYVAFLVTAPTAKEPA